MSDERRRFWSQEVPRRPRTFYRMGRPITVKRLRPCVGGGRLLGKVNDFGRADTFYSRAQDRRNEPDSLSDRSSPEWTGHGEASRNAGGSARRIGQRGK